MKKGFKLIICFMFIMMLCSCKKQSLSNKEFNDKLLKNAFSVMDMTKYSSEKTVKSIIAANNGKYQINYTIFIDENSAKKAFNANKKNIDVISDAKVVNKKGSNYQRYTQTLSDTYNVVVRVDNTMIYSSISIEYKKDLDKVLKNIGY